MKLKLVISAFLVILVAGFFTLKYYAGNLFEFPQLSDRSAEGQIPQTITFQNKDSALSQIGIVINQGTGQMDRDLQSIETIAPEEDPNSQGSQQREQSLDNMKKKTDKLIEARVSSLNRLLQRIQTDKGLTTDEQTLFSEEVKTNINQLNQLKAKIDTGTDINIVKADTKSIVSKFRIFAVFEPKIRMLVMIDNLSALSGKISSAAQKLQDLTNSLKSQGKDVSALQRLLNNINSDLAMINYKLAAAKQNTLSISVSSSPSAFSGIRKDLGTVKSEFMLIKGIIAQMKPVFNSVKGQKIAPPSVNPVSR